MSFSKYLQKKTDCYLESWQQECLPYLDKLTASYIFFPHLKGLYLYGPPGRGKTFLMDRVADYLPERTLRLHFFSLCALLQEYLNERHDIHFEYFFAEQCRGKILLIDELIIEDIADAMLFQRWFDKVQSRGHVLLITSNIAPDNLYLGGLKRDAFMPTIKSLKNTLTIFKLDSPVDLRGAFSQTNCVFYSIGQREQALENLGQCEEAREITLGTSRHLSIIRLSKTGFAVDVRNFFSQEAGKFDYQYLTCHYSTIVLCELHLFLWQDSSWCKRMVSFIDYCFDHQTKVYFHGISSYDDLRSALCHYLWPERTLSRFKQISSEHWPC